MNNKLETEIMEYTGDEKENLYESLHYWSNSCGEIHHGYTLEDLREEELPGPLLNAYHRLWEDGNGSYCYLAEFKNECGIILVNEFDKDFAEDKICSMEDLFEYMRQRAVCYSKDERFDKAKILLGKNTGCEECHEFIVFLPWNTSKETFDEIAALLLDTVYDFS